jgi:hypothetical protein
MVLWLILAILLVTSVVGSFVARQERVMRDRRRRWQSRIAHYALREDEDRDPKR